MRTSTATPPSTPSTLHSTSPNGTRISLLRRVIATVSPCRCGHSSIHGHVAAAVLTHRRSIIAVRVGLEWRLYFLLELAKLAWEEHNLAQTLKYIAQAKQIATQADQPHFLVPTPPPTPPRATPFLRSLLFNVTFHVVARASSFWWKRTWRLLDETSAPWCSTCSSTNKHTTPAPKARFRPRTPNLNLLRWCLTADAGIGEE